MHQSLVHRIVAAAGAVCLFCTSGASAIERSDDGAGQYLIVPFAIANSNNESLVEISDSTEESAARALKLRVLDRDGEPRLTANLYLARGATWAGGLTRQDDAARLLTTSDSCLLVEGTDGIEATDEVGFEFSAGSLEVVEMGIVVDPPLAAHVNDRDCEAIVDLWNDDAWTPDAALAPPAGDIRAGARIVNVSKGTLYGVPVTALKNFSNIVQHSGPGDAQPDLASTHDEGTSSGQTRSVVCVDGECIEDFWENPIDAASAALMTYTARASYDISESLNARSEWTVTLPAASAYPESHALSSASVSMLITERSGRSWTGVSIPTPPALPFFNTTTLWLDYEAVVNLLDFTTTVSEVGSVQDSRLFGLSHLVQSPGEDLDQMSPSATERLPENGQARFGFDCGDGAPVLVASSGRRYWGCPAIVTTFAEYTNGVLPGEGGVPQRANYGSSGAVSTSVRIDATED
ncbi:hypothetical protein [Wenzhouxiangella sp. EGI_FJ10409]|uniref:hypothetical protein n=1 Tax=Wenzhouxiangella sp. EGI_FJ10409 TaxID=3243767 RepID=UPI0035D64ABC